MDDTWSKITNWLYIGSCESCDRLHGYSGEPDSSVLVPTEKDLIIHITSTHHQGCKMHQLYAKSNDPIFSQVDMQNYFTRHVFKNGNDIYAVFEDESSNNDDCLIFRQLCRMANRSATECLKNNGRIFVHCMAGISRSVGVAYYLLLVCEKLNPISAKLLLRQERSKASPIEWETQIAKLYPQSFT